MQQLKLVLELVIEIKGKTKYCPPDRGGCGVVKRVSQFHANKHNRDNLSNVCGKCCNKKHAEQRSSAQQVEERRKSASDKLYKFLGMNTEVAKRLMKGCGKK